MNTLSLYEPFAWLSQIRRDMDQMLGRVVESQATGDSTVATSSWIPAVDLKEEAQQFVIEADIPGVDPKNIEISMANGVLTIRGERLSESREEGQNYKRVERLHGTFYRRFGLPDTADADKVVATGKNGVLRITIAKKEVAQPRKITVQG